MTSGSILLPLKSSRDGYEGSFLVSPCFCQVTAVAPGECDPECPPVQETVGAPAAVQSIVEQRVVLPATEGVTLSLGEVG